MFDIRLMDEILATVLHSYMYPLMNKVRFYFGN